jgi:hypothetical protein
VANAKVAPPEADHDGTYMARCVRRLAGRQARRIVVFHVQNADWAKDANEKNLHLLLTQRWLMAVLSDGCLIAVGMKSYGLDKAKDTELELHHVLHKEVPEGQRRSNRSSGWLHITLPNITLPRREFEAV